MSLEQDFKNRADAWAKHCEHAAPSSSISDYIDDQTYKDLVALGKPAVPLIIERYKADTLPWGFVLQDITGVNMIPNPNRFKPAKVKADWMAWWDKHGGEYSG